MNNEETKYMNGVPTGNNRGLNIPNKLIKKQGSNTGKVVAGTAAGVLGGAAAGVGGMYAKDKWDEKHGKKVVADNKDDANKDDVNLTAQTDKHEAQMDKREAELDRREHNLNQREAEFNKHVDNHHKQTEELNNREDGNYGNEDANTHRTAYVPDTPTHDGPNVQVISTETIHTENGDMDVTMAVVEGHQAVLVDVDRNGQNEIAAIDINDNNQLDQGEVIDLTTGEAIDVNQTHFASNEPVPEPEPEPMPIIYDPTDPTDPTIDPAIDPAMDPMSDPTAGLMGGMVSTDPTSGIADYQSDADVSGLV